MENRKETIAKILGWLNNEEEYGGLWLPAIQRPFVWSTEQIELLFDSIMRSYPINTFLIWKTREPLRLRRFVTNYVDNAPVTDLSLTAHERRKSVLLDGQQRVQSLYIGLKGSYNGKELYFNVLSGNSEESAERFLFKFLPQHRAAGSDGWVKVRDVLAGRKGYYAATEEVIEKTGGQSLPYDKKERIRKNIDILFREFRDRENIVFQELDSIYQPDLYRLDDVAEIFIRTNSGGTILSKSDLIFSLLRAGWEELDEKVSQVAEDLADRGVGVTRDHIVKTSLALIGEGATLSVEKLRKKSTLKKIISRFADIAAAIQNAAGLLSGLVRGVTVAPFPALIPIAYFRSSCPQAWASIDKNMLRQWLLKALIAGAFSGASDALIDALVHDIDERNDFDTASASALIKGKGRSLSLPHEELLGTTQKHRNAPLLLALLHHGRSPAMTSEGSNPSMVQIFPSPALKQMKRRNNRTGRKVLAYSRQERDQIANIMLVENGEEASVKEKSLPDTWFAGRSAQYLDAHLIPKDPTLWKVENFEHFIAERKQLLLKAFKEAGITN
jgi:Protein of unknown function DUF262